LLLISCAFLSGQPGAPETRNLAANESADKDSIVRYVHGGWGTGMDLTPEVKKLVE
jgi:hypothetical protein